MTKSSLSWIKEPMEELTEECVINSSTKLKIDKEKPLSIKWHGHTLKIWKQPSCAFWEIKAKSQTWKVIAVMDTEAAVLSILKSCKCQYTHGSVAMPFLAIKSLHPTSLQSPYRILSTPHSIINTPLNSKKLMSSVLYLWIVVSASDSGRFQISQDSKKESIIDW